MSRRWNNKGKNNCANYNYWCDKLAKNCGRCDTEDRYSYGNGSNW